MTETWYQLNVEFEAPTASTHSPVDVSQLPYYTFLIGPRVGFDRKPLKFPAVRCCADSYLAVTAEKFSLASTVMISTDIVTRGLLGVPFPADWTGALDLTLAEMQSILSSDEIAAVGGDAIAVGLCRDAACAIGAMANFVVALAKNPQSWSAIREIVGRVWGRAAVQRWLAFSGKSVGALFDLWTRAEDLTGLMRSTWTAPDRDGFRVDSVR
jgi:hypothetical protein